MGITSLASIFQFQIQTLEIESQKFNPSKHLRHPPGTVINGIPVGGQFRSKQNGQSGGKSKNKNHFAKGIQSDFSNFNLRTKEGKRVANILSFPIETDFQMAECLSKRIAYLNPKDKNSERHAITMQFLEDHNLQIADNINDPETGFNVYRISSKDGKNQAIVFTGTNDLVDWKSNIFDDEVGRSQFESHREDIKEMLMDAAKESGKKPQIFGHSLGGALAQITVTEFPEQIESATVFNTASINVDTAKKYVTAENPPPVKLVYNEQDRVPVAKGSAIIPGEVEVYRPEDDTKREGVVESHIRSVSDPRNDYKKITPLESIRIARKRNPKDYGLTNYEKIRQLAQNAKKPDSEIQNQV